MKAMVSTTNMGMAARLVYVRSVVLDLWLQGKPQGDEAGCISFLWRRSIPDGDDFCKAKTTKV